MNDVRTGHGGCVVHAVADHDHLAEALLERLDLGHLVLGQQLRVHLVEAELAGERLGDPAVVAREHHRVLHTLRLERGDGGLRRLTRLVAHGDDPYQLAVLGDEHARLSVAFERLVACRERHW